MKENTSERASFYPHHCEDCIYLGVGKTFEDRQLDMYYCRNQADHFYEESIVARWGQPRYSNHAYPVEFISHIDPESKQKNSSLQPFLFGLEQAKKNGLIKQL